MMTSQIARKDVAALWFRIPFRHLYFLVWQILPIIMVQDHLPPSLPSPATQEFSHGSVIPDTIPPLLPSHLDNIQECLHGSVIPETIPPSLPSFLVGITMDVGQQHLTHNASTTNSNSTIQQCQNQITCNTNPTIQQHQHCSTSDANATLTTTITSEKETVTTNQGKNHSLVPLVTSPSEKKLKYHC